MLTHLFGFIQAISKGILIKLLVQFGLGENGGDRGELILRLLTSDRPFIVLAICRTVMKHDGLRLRGHDMLIREGQERTITIDMQLAAVLSLVAGAVNSAGFHALGFFSANMTGNASMLSDLLAIGDVIAAAGFLMIIASFILGAYASAWAIEYGRRRMIKGIYARVIGAEAVALIILGLGAWMIGASAAAPLLLPGLSFLMGFQNAATTRISNARVRTTHISGVATDIGIGLATFKAGSPEARAASTATMRLHFITIASFIVGGLVGVLMYERVGGAVLVLAGSLLLLAAVRETIRARSG